MCLLSQKQIRVQALSRQGAQPGKVYTKGRNAGVTPRLCVTRTLRRPSMSPRTPCKICGDPGSPVRMGDGKVEYLCLDCAHKMIRGDLCWVPETEAIIEVIKP